MPYEDPDPQDPMMLVGVSLPGDRESQVDMTYAFAEEFARMGYDEARILALFQKPFYAAAHRAWADLGADRVERIVRECAGAWGRARLVDRDSAPPPCGCDGEVDHE